MMVNRRSICVIHIIIAAALFLSACGRSASSNGGAAVPAQDKTVVREAEYAAVLAEAKQKGVEVESGLYLTRLYAYTGVFPEDTDGKEVKNAAAAELVNLSPVAYRGLEFTVTCGKTAYRFFVSALPVGGRLTAVEQSGAALIETQDPAVSVSYADPYAERLSVQTEKLRITYTDGRLTVENKTEQPQKNVCVYYKRTDENGYLGGLTFRVRVGDVAAGKTAESEAKYLKPGGSKVVFVTVDEE